MDKPSLKKRIQYSFDNYMSKGFVALITALGALSFLLILLAAGTVSLTGWGPNDIISSGFIEAFWASLMRTLDPGTMGGDTGWGFRLIMFGVTLGGIFVISTLIGVLSNALETKLDELRKGRSCVIEKDHTLILGWSSQIFTIVSELIISNEQRNNSCIVILGERDKVEMEDELRVKIADFKNTRIVCRSGTPIDVDDLSIVSPQTSKSIIVLPAENANPDATVIKTILAITQSLHRRSDPYHIVAQIHHPKNMEVAQMVGGDEVELIQISDMISRLIAQTCRQSGLSIVYSELVGYDGDEIYFQQEPSMIGMKYEDIIFKYSKSAIIGVFPKNGEPKINPKMDYIFKENDQIMAISEDYNTIIAEKDLQYTINEDLISKAKEETPTAESTIILGWNWRAPAIINELDYYVAPGSSILVVSTEQEAEKTIEHECCSLENQTVKHVLADTTDRGVLDSLDILSFKHIIVLSYSDKLVPQEADSVTLITLLHIRDIAKQIIYPLSIVSEMLDQRNRTLAQANHADDFIVSNQFISQVVTQVSQNKNLNTVFKDLFDSDGSEIYLKLAKNYVNLNEEVNFFTVLESAKRKGETAIGYHLKNRKNADSHGVTINPLKSDMIVFKEWDRIVVLAED